MSCRSSATSRRCCAISTRRLADLDARPLTSIFLGGGTPSLFSPRRSVASSSTRATRLGFAADIEITLEANPGTIERGRFAEYRAAGVTRVSLGAQSFDERQLKLLGRIHSADETRRAAEELHAAGLANFNLDLMYALPGQTADEAQADLHAALALNPAHLSQYHLTIEPGTLFAAAPPVQPADEIVEDMLERCLQSLEEAGFEQYEVSGYARAGRAALTTSTTGPSATTSASAPARTASFRFADAVSPCVRSRRASRGATWLRSLARWSRKPIRRRTCRSSSR